MRRSIATLLILLPLAAHPAVLAGQATATDSAKADAEAFFTRKDAVVAGAFVLGTLGLAQVDGRLARTFQNPGLQESAAVRHGASFFQFMGQPAPEVIGAVLWGAGRVAHNRPIAALGLHGLESLLLSAGITKAMKGMAGRARPFVHADTVPDDFAFLRGFREGRDYSSFPSGHTATAFSVAASTTGEAIHWAGVKGWSPTVPYLVGGTLFTGAALVGVSRMYHDQHWASDVVGGAAIGMFSGFKVVKYAYRHPANRLERWLLPLRLEPGSAGALRIEWSSPLR